MSDATGFPHLVPGFEFFQGLVKNAGSALPGIGQWVAPTLDPDELGRRIEELRTVKFWLEQNARILDTTVQALEVQRMTLSTLKTMNVQMEDLRESLKVPLAGSAATAASAKPAAAASERGATPAAAARATTVAAPKARGKRAAASPPASPAPAASAAPATSAAPAVDPMQWWTALTQQFTEIAAQALKDATPGVPAPVPAPASAAATSAEKGDKPRARARPRSLR
jgi:hypothetical protein